MPAMRENFLWDILCWSFCLSLSIDLLWCTEVFKEVIFNKSGLLNPDMVDHRLHSTPLLCYALDMCIFICSKSMFLHPEEVMSQENKRRGENLLQLLLVQFLWVNLETTKWFQQATIIMNHIHIWTL